MQGNWNPHTLLDRMHYGTVTLENTLELLKMLNTELPNDSAILPLGIYPGEMKTNVKQ